MAKLAYLIFIDACVRQCLLPFQIFIHFQAKRTLILYSMAIQIIQIILIQILASFLSTHTDNFVHPS